MWKVVSTPNYCQWYIEDTDTEARKALGLRKSARKKVGPVGARRANYYDDALIMARERNLRDYGVCFDA